MGIARRTDIYNQSRNDCANHTDSIPIGRGRVGDSAVGADVPSEWRNEAYPIWGISALPSVDQGVGCWNRFPVVFVERPGVVGSDLHLHGSMAVGLLVGVGSHGQAADAVV